MKGSGEGIGFSSGEVWLVGQRTGAQRQLVEALAEDLVHVLLIPVGASSLSLSALGRKQAQPLSARSAAVHIARAHLAARLNHTSSAVQRDGVGPSASQAVSTST